MIGSLWLVVGPMSCTRPLWGVDFVQTLSYLKASGYKVALLFNFGAKQLGIKWIVYEKGRR
jgi:hypothetical protein